VRVRLIFSLESKGASLPFHHQSVLNSLFRDLMTEAGISDQHARHLFNFSGLKGQTRISRRGLHYLSNKVTVVVSAADETFMDALVSHILQKDMLTIGELRVKPESADLEKIPDFEEATKFVCISPVILSLPMNENGSAKQFISPLNEYFSDLLYESTLLRMKDSGNYTSDQIQSYYKFQVVPDKAYLLKIKKNNKKFARIYHLQDGEAELEVRGYTFPFTLYAAKEVQEFLFTCGLGYYTNFGFGMLDVADPISKKETDVWKTANSLQ